VKCDESRPSCGQCARLGHRCDYSPRLTFRDDTSRVVDRMTEVSVAGNAVWDCKCFEKYRRNYMY
jgi:Fungal Zn(2)-Cys(6) binuclear cluster domain